MSGVIFITVSLHGILHSDAIHLMLRMKIVAIACFLRVCGFRLVFRALRFDHLMIAQYITQGYSCKRKAAPGQILSLNLFAIAGFAIL